MSSAAQYPLLRQLHDEMLRIRVIERRIAERYKEQEMRCPVHLSIGQEAVGVGVCAHLRRQDRAMSAHRSHGHYLAKGGDVFRMLAELYGRAGGCCGGRGGSMHLMDHEAGFWGAVPIVGSTLPIAVGMALADKKKGGDLVTVAFLGEAATEEGVFPESLNLACVLKLPMLFICENNGFSVYTPIQPRRSAEFDFPAFVKSHGARHLAGDGNDVEAVHRLTGEALTQLRADPTRPLVLEFETWRYYEHCGPNFDDNLGYRRKEDIENWAARDPVDVARRRLLAASPALAAELDALEQQHIRAVDVVIERVRSSPRPDPATLMERIWAP